MSTDWDDTVASLPGDLDSDPGPAQAYLVVIRGNNVGETFPVSGPSMVIGRGAGADLRLNDEGVSRFHCKLHQKHNGVVVEDLGSRNGTFCNGEPVLPGMRALVEGDRLQIGTTFVLRFTYVESSVRASMTNMQDEVYDPLTGAFGRRYFMDKLESEVALVLANQDPLSLILVHVDRYSEIVADHGQPALDHVLVSVANHIRQSVPTENLLSRIGTGDFAIISKKASPGNTFMLAERLRKTAATGLGIKLSLGIAASSELSVAAAHDLLVAAGSALHRARSQGGDRTVLCTPELLREPRNRASV